MKTPITIIFVVLVHFFAFNQVGTNTNQPPFFAQCAIELANELDYQNLETQLRENPYVKIVRVDAISKRVFLLTQDVTSFSEADFKNWITGYEQFATCYQVGVHGVDVINPYPFTNCQ